MPNKRDKNKVQVGAFVPREIRDLANQIAKKYGISMTDEILKAYVQVIQLDQNKKDNNNERNSNDKK